MQPEEFKHLKAFKDLIVQTRAALQGAGSQATLASVAGEYAARWEPVHDEFAEVLRGIKAQAWQMPFPQVRAVVGAVLGHLDATLAEVEEKLGR